MSNRLLQQPIFRYCGRRGRRRTRNARTSSSRLGTYVRRHRLPAQPSRLDASRVPSKDRRPMTSWRRGRLLLRVQVAENSRQPGGEAVPF